MHEDSFSVENTYLLALKTMKMRYSFSWSGLKKAKILLFTAACGRRFLAKVWASKQQERGAGAGGGVVQ